MNPLTTIDQYLNPITMYKLVRFGLSILIAVAAGLAFAGVIPMPGWWLLASAGVILTVGYVAGELLSLAYDTPSNSDSTSITSQILILIMAPAASAHDLWLLALVSLLAVASKYVLAYHRKHIFNPVAIAAAVMTVSGLYPVTWWVGTPILLPLVAVFGFLVLRKIRRLQMFTAFFVSSVIGIWLLALTKSATVTDLLLLNIVSGPLVFFGSIMVSEPSTMPARVRQQIIFGALVGLLAVTQLRIGPVYMSALLALLVGNIYAYVTGARRNAKLTFVRREQLSPRVFEYIFTPDRPLAHLPGQYMEWTLPLRKADLRGNRRSFTIASAPEATQLRMGVKHYQPSSTYKIALDQLRPGNTIMGAHVAGDFVMPRDPNRKLVFLAGGIGVTPFVSMVKHLLATDQRRDITLFHLVAAPDDLTYRKLFIEAAKVGVTYIPVVAQPDAAWTGLTGLLTIESMRAHLNDLADYTYFISGPNFMVDSFEQTLRSAGVVSKNIVTDHFSGY